MTAFMVRKKLMNEAEVVIELFVIKTLFPATSLNEPPSQKRLVLCPTALYASGITASLAAAGKRGSNAFMSL